jgi:hypothetical protein
MTPSTRWQDVPSISRDPRPNILPFANPDHAPDRRRREEPQVGGRRQRSAGPGTANNAAMGHVPTLCPGPPAAPVRAQGSYWCLGPSCPLNVRVTSQSVAIPERYQHRLLGRPVARWHFTHFPTRPTSPRRLLCQCHEAEGHSCPHPADAVTPEGMEQVRPRLETFVAGMLGGWPGRISWPGPSCPAADRRVGGGVHCAAGYLVGRHRVAQGRLWLARGDGPAVLRCAGQDRQLPERVSMHAVTGWASAAIRWRLFLAASWDDDIAVDASAAEQIAQRRVRCKIPGQVRHREKWRLALDVLDEITGPQAAGAAGQARGRRRRIRDNTASRLGLQARGLPYVAAVRASPAPAQPVPCRRAGLMPGRGAPAGASPP